MKKSLFAVLATGVLMFGITEVSSAAPILQSSFSPSAIVYDFSGATIGQTTISSGNLTVSNGKVFNTSLPGGMNAPTYYDGNDSSVMRLAFGSAVSAVGMSIYVNSADITLNVFDASNLLLEAYTIDWHTLPISDSYIPYGFIGIDLGINSIAYATIDTPLNGDELFIDNITYQSSSAPVPEPGTIALLGLGMAGLAVYGKRRANKA